MIPTLQYDRFVVRVYKPAGHSEWHEFIDRTEAEGFYNYTIHYGNCYRIELVGCRGHAETILHTWRKIAC